jgi:lipopolysaccharide export system protein LptA
MKNILIVSVLFTSFLTAQELRIKADSFSADEGKGLSIFKGDVNIIKHNDEINASKVIIYTDKENQPTKFIATGSVSFKIETKQKAKYEGSAERIVYLPQEKEYKFFKNVHLKQLNDKKEIQGDEVILNTTTGKAYAKGLKKEPIIMIFDIKDEE